MQPSDLVVGVAGHIDHGKTALVRAITGIDTDRLPEEKARGITIELGFAHFALPSGRRVAVVDMPGHERFVRAMIAGAGGVDLILLVVAANEGVMPQTREHLAIAQLVGVRGGVVALSKADLASPEILELAAEEVREVLAGTALASAEIVPVSALAGTGLDALRAAIERAAVPPREATGPTLLPVDRVFVRKGFGAVVTGTLVSGTVREGDVLVVAPVGVEKEAREVRVRGLQIHGESVREARAGTRLAVNVAGLEAQEIPRGAWLFRAGEVALTRAFDAAVTTLPATRKALGRRARLELAVGAAHTAASVALLEGEELRPGGTALARVTTEEPVALRPGERFVLRGPPSLAGVGSTVGGGVVVRPVAERARRRDVALERARQVAEHERDVHARARVEAEAAGPRGLSASELFARAGLRAEAGELAQAGLMAVAADRYVASAVVESVGQKVLQVLSAHHGAEPASRGLERRALKGLGDDALVDAALARLLAQRKIEREGEVVFRAGWRPKDPDAVPFLRELEAALSRAGLMAPRPEEIAASLRTDARSLEPALKRLVQKGAVVRVNAELYVAASAMADLERRLVAHLEAHGTIDAQGFKELTGASRKWTIPLAEYFDGKKVTLRVGDVRKLRR
jgi:selenocysteine-specific elongation factor